MTGDIVPAKRTEEYISILQQLKSSFIRAGEMVVKLYERGKKDGLPNHVIRQDIETALDGVVKERRLRELLPLELKRGYAITDKNNLAISAESTDTYIKSTEELVRECKDLMDEYMSVYVPEACEVLLKEHHGWTTEEIKNRIKHDFAKFYPGIADDRHLQSWSIENQATSN
jgi:hypothetical protein